MTRSQTIRRKSFPNIHSATKWA